MILTFQYFWGHNLFAPHSPFPCRRPRTNPPANNAHFPSAPAHEHEHEHNQHPRREGAPSTITSSSTSNPPEHDHLAHAAHSEHFAHTPSASAVALAGSKGSNRSREQGSSPAMKRQSRLGVCDSCAVPVPTWLLEFVYSHVVQ